MKILICVEFYDPHIGGAEKHCKLIAEYLNKNNYKVEIATSFLKERKKKIINGVRINEFNVKGNFIRGYSGDITNYQNFLINSKFDRIIFYAAQQWSFDLSIEIILGYVFAPIAWLMGIPWSEAVIAGELLGIKTTLNEFVAYPGLAALDNGELSDRSKLITFYSLCGFANLSSVGILISGITAMAPERKDDLINVSFKALVGATLASCMTGLIVGIFI